MSLPDILRDIDMKAADCVQEDKENTVGAAPVTEKVVMRPHSMAQVKQKPTRRGVACVCVCMCVCMCVCVLNNIGVYRPLSFSCNLQCASTAATPPSVYGRHSVVSVESCESVSDDEGEARWDSLGRMNSIRRSNRFDKPQLLTVVLRNGKAGCGITMEGKEPPSIASLGEYTQTTMLLVYTAL